MSAVKKIGSAVTGAIGGFATGGPVGAIAGGLGGLLGSSGSGGQSQVPIPGATGDMNGGNSTANSIIDFLKNNSGLLTAGTGLAALLGGGNPLTGVKNVFGGLTTPQTLNDPRNQLLSTFSNSFNSALKSNPNMTLGQLLQSIGSTQGYQGPLSVDQNANQTGASSGLNDFIQQFTQSGAGSSALDPLKQIASGANTGTPTDIQSVLNGASPDILKLIAAGGDPLSGQIQNMVAQNPAVAALFGSANFASPEQGGLNAVAGMVPGATSGASSILSQIAQGGTGADFNSISQAIQNAMQPQIARGLRDLNEQYGGMGIDRSGSNLSQAAGQYLTDTNSQIAGQLAQIAPQIFGQDASTKLAAATGLGNLGSSNIQQMIQALTSAGQLGTAGQGLNLQALTSGGSLQQGGIGSLLSLLNNQTGAAQGLQSGNLNTAQILSQIFNNQQNNQTSAAQSLPGATSTITNLLPALFGQQFGMGQTQFTDQMQNLMNQFGGFQQSQSLIPQFLSMISGTGQPMTYGSPLSQLTNAGSSIALMMKLLQG